LEIYSLTLDGADEEKVKDRLDKLEKEGDQPAKDGLKDAARDLKSLLKQRGFERFKETIETQVFLLQRELETWVQGIRDVEQERRRADPDAANSLREEQGWIETWVRSQPLPVVARVYDRFTVRDINAGLDPDRYRVVARPSTFTGLPDEIRLGPDGEERFARGRIVDRTLFDQAEEELVKKADPGEDRPTEERNRDKERAREEARKAAPPAKPIGDKPTYVSLTILPSVKFTLPLLLLFLSIWFAWRVVNLPTFGDFLIATEGELNKVSWSTRAQLVRDTIVVLVTVLLMAVFLFLVDLAWANLLSSRVVGVLQLPPEKETQKDESKLKW
jgi:preprotein translocase SecE subunit